MIHILVVDDERQTTHLLKRILQGGDRSIVVADSAEEALEKLEDVDFNLIVSDCHMPGMTGLELAKKVRARGFKRVFILNSGGLQSGEEKTQLRTLIRNGTIQAFLQKPWRVFQMRETVNSALALSMATQVLPSEGNDS